jgi:putative hydrolase of the HAD superfamily
MFRAVLFDAVGTLIRLAEPVGETYARFARSFDLEVEPDRLQEGFRANLRKMPAMVFPGETPRRIEHMERAWWRELVARTFAPVTKQSPWPRFDDCFDALFRHFSTADAWRVAPGGRELLVELRKRGACTGVVSNFDQRLHEVLESLQLRALLDVVVLPSDAGAAKPDPRIFQLALRRIGVSPGEALYVGDDPEEDFAGARAAGLAAMDVTSLDRLEDLLQRCSTSD